jgi:hypothetical protein
MWSQEMRRGKGLWPWRTFGAHNAHIRRRSFFAATVGDVITCDENGLPGEIRNYARMAMRLAAIHPAAASRARR